MGGHAGQRSERGSSATAIAPTNQPTQATPTAMRAARVNRPLGNDSAICRINVAIGTTIKSTHWT